MLASVSGSITHAVGTHGVYAVFALLVLAAVIPVASELVMLYAGAVAGGAFADVAVHVFGREVQSSFWGYVLFAVAGTLGNVVGCSIGWWIGRRGGLPLLRRYGRYIHVGDDRIARADRWFERFGSWAVPLGLATPLVRSFVAIPAGIFEVPYRRFLPLSVLGCAVFCFGLAGIGWALGTAYTHAHDALRWVDVVVVVGGVLVLAAYLIWRWLRPATVRRRADDPAD
ncbi:MAG TPA: DedA family protein [Gaiellaceae bacterium]|nr:DedA family protein [Gaiellaceae bacterium]